MRRLPEIAGDAVEVAIAYADAGFFVFPVLLRKDGDKWTKQPLVKWTEESSSDPDDVAAMFRGLHFDNGVLGVGLDCGKSHLWVLDQDLGGTVAGLPLAETAVSQTVSGGKHYWYENGDGVRNSTGRVAKNIDVRGDGGFVVAPGCAHYSLVRALPIAKAGRDLVALVRDAPNPSGRVSKGQRNDKLFRKACSLRTRGAEFDDLWVQMIAWNDANCDPPLDTKEVRAICENVVRRYQPAPATADGADFDVKEDGTLRGNERNCVELIVHGDGLAGVFRYDTMRRSVVMAAEPPWGGLGPIQDADVTHLLVYLQRSYGFSIGFDRLNRCVDVAAKMSPFNPLLEELQSIKWDGRWRCADFLKDYVGCVGNAQYLQEVSLCMLGASVKRLVDPGCKHDSMLVIEGDQGIGKSRAVRALYGEEYFSDSIGAIREINSADGLQHMAGKWCLEFAELSSLRHADVDKLKDFLSGTIDTYRAPYERRPINHPRQCVFIGTVNPTGVGWHKDSTGGRRFWPVVCSGAIDVDRIERDRAQIWAEAFEWIARPGFQWWLTPEMEAHREVLTRERTHADTWGEIITKWLEDPTITETVHGELVVGKFLTDGVVSTDEILAHALDVPKSQRDRGRQMRVGEIMHGAGFVKRQFTHKRGRLNWWVLSDEDECG